MIVDWLWKWASVGLPGQAKVGHLDRVLRSDEAVARGQIAVDVVVAFQVGHAFAHLERAASQYGDGKKNKTKENRSKSDRREIN